MAGEARKAAERMRDKAARWVHAKPADANGGIGLVDHLTSFALIVQAETREQCAQIAEGVKLGI